jgi:hypothetical protein
MHYTLPDVAPQAPVPTPLTVATDVAPRSVTATPQPVATEVPVATVTVRMPVAPAASADQSVTPANLVLAMNGIPLAAASSLLLLAGIVVVRLRR